jgi:hypothetical protein
LPELARPTVVADRLSPFLISSRSQSRVGRSYRPRWPCAALAFCILHSSFFLGKLADAQNPVPDSSISVTASRPSGYQISHSEKFENRHIGVVETFLSVGSGDCRVRTTQIPISGLCIFATASGAIGYQISHSEKFELSVPIRVPLCLSVPPSVPIRAIRNPWFPHSAFGGFRTPHSAFRIGISSTFARDLTIGRAQRLTHGGQFGGKK